MYFGIYGEDEVDNIVLRGKKSVLIRICGNKSLETSNLYDRILELDIYDIVSYKCLTNEFKLELINQFIKLNEFVLDNDFDEVIVHCSLGISRSPAIMICISKILGNIKMEKIIKDNFFNYNKIILNEFENFNYIKKNVNISDTIFIGHFINKNEKDFMIESVGVKEYNLILKRKKY